MTETYNVVLLVEQGLSTADAVQVHSLHEEIEEPVAYHVLLPLEGDPAIVFPREATYVGEHGTTWIGEQVFVDRPGDRLADQVRGKRVGAYGLDYVMTVRDYRALAGTCDLVSWDVEFDHARAVPRFLQQLRRDTPDVLGRDHRHRFVERLQEARDRARFACGLDIPRGILVEPRRA